MNRLFLALSLALAVSQGSVSLASTHSVSITTDDSRAIERCDQIRVRFGGEGNPLEIVRSEERFVATKSEVAKLRVTLAGPGGIDVQGWDRDGYQITVCKMAGARGSSRAQEILDRIAVSFQDGSLSAEGSDGGDWLAYAIVRVPKNAELELSTENGGIALREVEGTIRTRTRNGPIGLTKCSGDVRADTENGPINSGAGAGQQKLVTRNGPVNIDLTGGRWTGDGLRARTENGPLNLRIGNDAPAVRVETAGHSPLRCRAKACARARDLRDGDSRRIELGEGRPLVRLSTINGPVNITGSGDGRSGATRSHEDDDEEAADEGDEDGII